MKATIDGQEFTMSDLEKAHAKIYNDKQSSRYSFKQNPLTYKLSKMKRQERGVTIEHMIAEKLSDLGYEAEVTAVTSEFDIIIYSNGKRIRCEVKSSCIMPNDRYNFQNIKPEDFDICFFAFVAPEGLQVKFLTSKHIKRFVNTISHQKRGNNGYSIGANYICENLRLAQNGMRMRGMECVNENI